MPKQKIYKIVLIDLVAVLRVSKSKCYIHKQMLLAIKFNNLRDVYVCCSIFFQTLGSDLPFHVVDYLGNIFFFDFLHFHSSYFYGTVSSQSSYTFKYLSKIMIFDIIAGGMLYVEKFV